MKDLAVLAWRSLRNRWATAMLAVATIASSVILLGGVLRLQDEARAGFLRSVAGTDLIVGARAHPVQLLLYSVFRIGDATNNVRWDTYAAVTSNPAIAWSVPISLGDSHRGFRVVGTTTDYFTRIGTTGGKALYFEQGEPFDDLFDAVVGADVAERLGYAPGARIVLAHGTAAVSTQQHDDRPFTVVGVLARTGTAIDQGVYVSLAAIEAIHLNWTTGTRIGTAPAAPDPALLEPKTITAFYLGMKSRAASFAVQRAINTYDGEALTAILPGVALQQLWGLLAGVERVLLVAAACVLATALLVLLTAVLASLNERRREMSVLRACGAGARHVFALLLLEAALLAGVGALLGAIVLELLAALAAPWLMARYGVLVQPDLQLSIVAIPLLAALAGVLVGLVPALLAFRRSLQDGLRVDR